MKFIIGEKIGMTQIFDTDGRAVPATVVKTCPQVVTQIKNLETDGYFALQVGFQEAKEKKIKKPQKGHLKDLGNYKYFKEFRLSGEDLSSFKVGDKIVSSIFSENDDVCVSAVSKAKGFQGVVKRHGFAGGPRTHGQKHSEREPGSIGGGGRAGGRVVKGMKMAGRMGGDRVTVKNLKIVKVDNDEGYLMVSGAVPGRKGTFVEILSVK